MHIESLRTDLHRIVVPSPTLPPATTTNAWITDSKRGLVKDPAAHIPSTQAALITHLTPFSPRAVLLTHHHRDHIAAAQAIREHFNIPVLAHKKTAALIDIPVDQHVKDGEQLTMTEDVWTAVHTPGHAPGHLCLLSKQDRTVIAGDMVAGEGTILINPSEGSIREYIHSLTLLQQLSPFRLLPAHGPVLNDPQHTLTTYIQHRKARILQIWNLLNTTPQHPLELATQIYTELPTQFLPMAAIQVKCGLLYLAEDDVVQQQEAGWVRHSTSYSL